MISRLFDAHAHPQESQNTLAHLSTIFKSSPVTKMCVMATSPKDWASVASLSLEYPDNVVPCFGIHPWWAYTSLSAQTWQIELSELLDRHPNAIVGEIGVDTIAKTPDDIVQKYKQEHSIDLAENTFETIQKDLFRKQFDLAVEKKRAVSLHIVKAHGFLLEFLQERLARIPSRKKLKEAGMNVTMDDVFPPAIMLHSYSGTRGSLKQLLNLEKLIDRMYFSFSQTINGRYLGLNDVIKACPDDQLLIESDVCCATKVEEAMEKIFERVSTVKGWSKNEAQERLWNNSKKCYKL